MVTAPANPTIEMTPLDRAAAALGSRKALADALGISAAAVSQWEKVPAGRVLQIEALTRVSRHELRPDIFGPAPKVETVI